MTLEEFLLARIAEDEFVANCKDAQPPWIDAGYPQGSYFIGFDGSSGTTYLAIDPARVIAECDSKRQVIEGISGLPFENALLRRLAIPYARHPDFRDQWKP